MISIGVLGTGYVGLVTGACLASTETNYVTCFDINRDKIDMLNNGEVPIYEKDLGAIIRSNIMDCRLQFSHEIDLHINNASVIFIAVGTPSKRHGGVDLSYIESACKMIAEFCDEGKVIVMKSTVPVGTHKKVQEWLGSKHHIVSNPEFLREGTAIYDFTHGDRIVIGTHNGLASATMSEVYADHLDKIIWMDNASAEMVKYASNCLLATRLALWNEIAVLSDATGANIHKVREGCIADKRIGKHFLLAGPGYGGSCFPKDTRGLLQMFENADIDDRYGRLIEEVIESNITHKDYIFDSVNKYFNHDLKGQKVAVLGLAFKSGTDDVRESPAHRVIQLLDIYCADKIVVCDPVATELPKKFHDSTDIELTTDIVKALKDADILFLMTEWPQYRNLDIDYVDSLMRGNVIADARNMWNRQECEARGFKYFGIGS